MFVMSLQFDPQFFCQFDWVVCSRQLLPKLTCSQDALERTTSGVGIIKRRPGGLLSLACLSVDLDLEDHGHSSKRIRTASGSTVSEAPPSKSQNHARTSIR